MAQRRHHLAAAFLLVIVVNHCSCKDWESFQLTVPHPQGERIQLALAAHVVGDAREGEAHVLVHRSLKELKLQHLKTSSKNRTEVTSSSNDQTIKVDSPHTFKSPTLPTSSTNVLASLQARRGVSSTLTLLDAYRPISDRCLGRKYIVAPVEARAGHSFIVVKSLQEELMVTLTLNSDPSRFYGGLLEYDGRLYGPGDTIVMKLKPHSSKTLTSVDVGSGMAMTGMTIVTSEPAAVFTGSVASEPENTGVNARRLTSAVSYEMLPPVSMLGTQYVVSNPDVAALTGGRLTIVKIIAIYDMTNIRVTSYAGSGPRQAKVSSNLGSLQSGQVVTKLLKPSASLVVASDHPVQVLQVIVRDDGRHESMAVLPARHAWTNMYQVHALPVRDQAQTLHRATIVAETAQIQDLLVISQPDYTDLSPDLEWVTIGDTGLSTTTVVVKQFSPTKIFHIDEKASFQVMVTGINTKGTGAYTTTAGRNPRCEGTVPYKAESKSSASVRLLFRPKRSVTAPPVVTSTTTPADSTTTGVTVSTTPSDSSTTTAGAANTTVAIANANVTTAAANVTSNVTTAAANVASNATTQAPAADPTTTAAPESSEAAMSTGAIAGTAAAVGAAVTGAVVAVVAVNATGAAVAASGAAATAVGVNVAAAGAAAGNAAAAAGANAAATGAMVSTTHGGATAIASAANPAMVAVV